MTTQHSGDRLRQKMLQRGITPTDLAGRLRVSTQNLNNWFSRGVPGKSLLSIATILGIHLKWLQDGEGVEDLPAMPSPSMGRVESNAVMLGPIDVWDDDTPLDDDEVYVPFLKEVELSAGSGKTVVQQSHRQKLRLGIITMRRQGVQPSDAVCVTVSGNSMEPVLPDGCTVGIDQGTTAVTDGKMYAIDHAGQLRVKTLYRIPGGGIRMRSFNREEHPDEEYTQGELQEMEINIIGRVFWSSALW
jgi:phage repressor protein C with HTH and peptisase S24 domain